MLINEILNVDPLPYRWITPTTGIFELDGVPFGIVLESYTLRLPARSVSVVNISFGVMRDVSVGVTPQNIDRTLTNFGKPRTVMATVAVACIDNPTVKQHDIIIVAASDQVKEKRIGVYTLAINELASKMPEYKFSYRAHTPTGSILVVESHVELNQDEVQFVATEVLGKDS